MIEKRGKKKLESYFMQESIPGSSFGYSTIRQIVFPQTSLVKRIGSCAFSDCINLILVSINGTVQEIGSRCFYNCSKLTQFQINGAPNLRIIGDYAFEKTKIHNFKFPASLMKLGTKAVGFNDEYDLSETKLKIFESMFSHYDSSRALLRLPNTIRRLRINNIFKMIKINEGGRYFMNERQNVIAKFHQTIYFVGKEYYSFTIRRGIEKINSLAFYNTKVRNIIFPASLKEISFQAFECCENLIRIRFSKNSMLIKICEYAFHQCEKLNKIKFPASLVDLGDCAFMGCESLYSATFPRDSKLKFIGRSTFPFCVCNLKLPANVKMTSSTYTPIDDTEVRFH